MRSARSVCALLLLSLAACGPAGRQEPRRSPGPDPIPAEVRQALVLPPGARAAEKLSWLAREASRGSCAAAWLRGQYLLDLFDAARISLGRATNAPAGLEGAHQVLWHGLGLSGDPGRGPTATAQVLRGLERILKAVPRACPLADLARNALLLLQADRAPRGKLAEALAVVVTYKRIARGGSPLAPNARLRLVDWCFQAFQLAAGGEPALQRARLNHCLLPLYDADPSPYFEGNPMLRPPDPPWPVLRRALSEELALLGGTRLHALGLFLSRQTEDFFSRTAALLPTPLYLSQARLPLSEHGLPWDRTPVVVRTSGGFVVGGRAVLAGDEDGLKEAIAARLIHDRRGRVAMVMEPDAPAMLAAEVARSARLAGAMILELGVAREVARRAPPGDVQAVLFGKGPVMRLEVLPVSLALVSARTAPPPSREDPRGLGFDPRLAPSGIALRVDRDAVRISSREGTLPPLRIQDLQPSLRALRRVYPDDTSLVLVPGPAAIYAELVLAAASARRDQSGAPLFPGQALAGPGLPPPPEDKDLSGLLRLLSGASVTVEPPVDRSLPTRLRGCYLQALRPYAQYRPSSRGSPPEGTLVLSRGRKGLRIAGGTVKDAKLRRCVAEVLRSRAATGQDPSLPADGASGGKLTVTFKRE